VAKKRDGNRLVYASDGSHLPRRRSEESSPPAPMGDDTIRVRREKKGRKGKTVSVISGLPLDEIALKDLAGELKRRCGSGGSAKAGTVEIQGDHVEELLALLDERGFKAKRTGG
jgi:translation initiation factor 1